MFIGALAAYVAALKMQTLKVNRIHINVTSSLSFHVDAELVDLDKLNHSKLKQLVGGIKHFNGEANTKECLL